MLNSFERWERGFCQEYNIVLNILTFSSWGRKTTYPLFSVFNAKNILKCQKQKRIEQQLSYINFLSSLVGGDKISGQNDLAVGEDKYEKILTRKEIHNKIEIKGRFVVRSLEKHLIILTLFNSNQ